jgi:competence protein ComEC
VKNALRVAVFAVALACALESALALPAAASHTVDIYFIDVEGGQSTLIVTPERESLLVDTGFAGFDGRDAGRIVAAARDAGVSRIDYLLLTHFHWDHDGGVVELARQMPIRTFVDHGDLDRTPAALAAAGWPVSLERYNAYLPVRATGKHIERSQGIGCRCEG